MYVFSRFAVAACHIAGSFNKHVLITPGDLASNQKVTRFAF